MLARGWIWIIQASQELKLSLAFNMARFDLVGTPFAYVGRGDERVCAWLVESWITHQLKRHQQWISPQHKAQRRLQTLTNVNTLWPQVKRKKNHKGTRNGSQKLWYLMCHFSFYLMIHVVKLKSPNPYTTARQGGSLFRNTLGSALKSQNKYFSLKSLVSFSLFAGVV